LRLLFAIGSGLRCRGEKHDPVPDLLTSSAFVGTDSGETSYKPTSGQLHVSLAENHRCNPVSAFG
jgi:hypothetical protein